MEKGDRAHESKFLILILNFSSSPWSVDRDISISFRPIGYVSRLPIFRPLQKDRCISGFSFFHHFQVHGQRTQSTLSPGLHSSIPFRLMDISQEPVCSIQCSSMDVSLETSKSVFSDMSPDLPICCPHQKYGHISGGCLFLRFQIHGSITGEISIRVLGYVSRLPLFRPHQKYEHISGCCLFRPFQIHGNNTGGISIRLLGYDSELPIYSPHYKYGYTSGHCLFRPFQIHGNMRPE